MRLCISTFIFENCTLVTLKHKISGIQKKAIFVQNKDKNINSCNIKYQKSVVRWLLGNHFQIKIQKICRKIQKVQDLELLQNVDTHMKSSLLNHLDQLDTAQLENSQFLNNSWMTLSLCDYHLIFHIIQFFIIFFFHVELRIVINCGTKKIYIKRIQKG